MIWVGFFIKYKELLHNNINKICMKQNTNKATNNGYRTASECKDTKERYP